MKMSSILALLFMCPFARGTVIIDDFSSGTLSLDVSHPAVEVSGARTGSMVGGVAFHALRILSNPLQLGSRLAIQPSQGTYTIASDLLVETSSIAYYGHGSDGFLGSDTDLNLSLVGENRFRVHVAAVDQDMRIDVVVHRNLSDGYHIMHASVPLVASSTGYSVDVPFSIFSPIQLGAFSIEQEIDAIYFFTPTVPSGDLGFTQFEAVPEPAGLFILTCGLSCFAAYSRRRRSQEA